MRRDGAFGAGSALRACPHPRILGGVASQSSEYLQYIDNKMFIVIISQGPPLTICPLSPRTVDRSSSKIYNAEDGLTF